MHTEIFNNIDLLIEMAGSSLNEINIEEELRNVNKEIQDKKQQIEDLKSMMNDTRYFNASSELVDKNIEVSLKSKISRLNRKIRDIQLKFNDIKKDEEKKHEEIIFLKQKIEQNDKYITLLESKESSMSTTYQKIVTQEKAVMQNLKQDLDQKNKKYQKILKELEAYEQALTELLEKKDKDTDKLREIEDNLANPNTYIDEDLKKQDEEKLNNLNELLESLHKRRLEYLTDPSMIGIDAKELIVNSNFKEALKKIKELVTIVKANPFMDISNNQLLDEELDKKENERIQLANYIDTKSYKEVNSEVIDKRIEYLNKEIEKLKTDVIRYQDENKKIEQSIDTNISSLIQNLEEDIKKVTEEINDYQNLIQDNSKSAKTKGNLQSTIIKKEKEKDIMYKLLDNYKEDLLQNIECSKKFEDIILNYNSSIKLKEQELDELKHLTLFDSVSKDYIEEEADKEKLKSITEEIKQIKNRKRFDKSADEIYDQIEMLLANANVNIKVADAKQQQEVEMPIDGLFDEKPKEERIKVIEMIPAQTIASETGGSSYGA